VLAELPYRQLAGLVEVSLTQGGHIKDKTSWQKMLKGGAADEEVLYTIHNVYTLYTIHY
jgi:hypothetical protein